MIEPVDLHGDADVRLPGECQAVGSILSRVGDKWTVLVVMMLAAGPRRFNELKRMIGGVSQRMLTLTLRGLERDGLVKRTPFATVPPRVDYELTDLGHSLRRPVEALGLWAFANIAVVERSRAAFDSTREVGDTPTQQEAQATTSRPQRLENGAQTGAATILRPRFDHISRDRGPAKSSS